MKTTREQAIGKIVDSLFAKIRLWSLNHEGNVKRSTKIYNYGVEEIEHLLDKKREGLIKKWEESTVLEFKRYIDAIKPKENNEEVTN